jgi:hypothetical protein
MAIFETSYTPIALRIYITKILGGIEGLMVESPLPHSGESMQVQVKEVKTLCGGSPTCTNAFTISLSLDKIIFHCTDRFDEEWYMNNLNLGSLPDTIKVVFLKNKVLN